MDTFRNTLLDWPHEAPSAATHTLADADFIHSLELGPKLWWQTWHSQRLAELLQWLGQGDLFQLPILRREDFRVQFETRPVRSPREHGKLAQFHSSGSSGVPVTFWRSDLATRINFSHYWADHLRQRRNLHATLAIITGTPGEHTGTHRLVVGEPWLHPGLQLARNAPQFTMLEHAHWVCEHAPTYLATTPATLSSILSLIELNQLKAPRIAQIMTSSHVVEPELRVRARRVFGTSIRDRYSCEELGPIAFQCPESDDYHHVAVANVVVEVVAADGSPAPEGVRGSVLVTGLHQWSSPILRYELGDISAMHSHCPACGATVPTLSQLMGRKYFLLHTPCGDMRHVRILAEHWLACAPVREHRVVQTSESNFRAEVVLDKPMDGAERQNLHAMLQRILGPEFSIDLVQVDAIPWPAGRKRQEFVGWVP